MRRASGERRAQREWESVNEAAYRRRAEELAAVADHPSVQAEVLAGQYGRITKSYLYDRPPVAYLAEGERPAYVLQHPRKGVAVGSRRDATTPDDDLSALTVVTDRRILCLVGRSSGDVVVEIPHEEVASVEASVGLLRRRLVVHTNRTVYYCFASRSSRKAYVTAAAEYVRSQVTDVEPDPSGEPVTWRGRAIAPAVDANGAATPAAAGGTGSGGTGADGGGDAGDVTGATGETGDAEADGGVPSGAGPPTDATSVEDGDAHAATGFDSDPGRDSGGDDGDSGDDVAVGENVDAGSGDDAADADADAADSEAGTDAEHPITYRGRRID